MTDTDKKLFEQVDKMVDYGYKRGKAVTFARKCFSIGFKAGKKAQEQKMTKRDRDWKELKQYLEESIEKAVEGEKGAYVDVLEMMDYADERGRND